ncbi:MAG: hypothetical protein ACON5H_02995 [Akkermansiaceae bacterium]
MRVFFFLSFIALLLSSCVSGPWGGELGNLGISPSPEVRRAQIAAEPRGDFYYGRRYYVQKTRFWGYLRKPGKSAKTAQLVIFNESKKRNPDRYPENGPSDRRYGFDQNYEYKIYGHYTGRTLYEPNSNQFLPEFELQRYELLDRSPGWLFSPSDVYSPTQITLLP